MSALQTKFTYLQHIRAHSPGQHPIASGQQKYELHGIVTKLGVEVCYTRPLELKFVRTQMTQSTPIQAEQ